MRTNLVDRRPKAVSDEEAATKFRDWLAERRAAKRAGKAAFFVTTNSQGEVTAIEGQSPPERLA